MRKPVVSRITLPEDEEAVTRAERPSGEYARARWWRENIVRLTRAELAKLVGFSASRIADIENGRTRSAPYRPIDEETMARYRLACAAVTLGVRFDWERCSISPRGAVDITVGFDPKS